MTTVPSDFRVPLPEAVVDLLGEYLSDLPDPEIIGGHLRTGVADQYDAVRVGSLEAREMTEHLRRLLDDEETEGFAVLATTPLPERYGSDDGLKAVTVVLSWLAVPLRPREELPLWRTLSADVLSSPQHPTGARPLHIDMIHTSRPPDYTATLCVRPDPCGGGASLVSHTRRAVARLSDEERVLLCDQVYRHAEPRTTTGVGFVFDTIRILDHLSPAPVGGPPPDDDFVRFDPSLLAGMDRADPYASAARALERELAAGQRRFSLEPGDLLIVNQHHCAHGHEVLGGDQRSVPVEHRRLVRQMFLHDDKSAF